MTYTQEKRLNPYDPFDNPTENTAYRSSYTEIEPDTGKKGFSLPLFPEKNERKKIRHYFNIAGLGLFAGYVGIYIVFYAFLFLMQIIFSDSFDEFYDYMYDRSSINEAMNALLFLGANLIPVLLAGKYQGLGLRSYFRPISIKKTTLGRYILIAVFIQAATGILYNIMDYIFASNNIDIYEPVADSYSSAKIIAVSFLYGCIVAPVTEELLYRGFVMKNLSRVSQRFGIIASAVLFGLAHENFAQIMLAIPFGIFMGRIVTKHNSLLPSMLCHAGVNTAAFLINMAYSLSSSDILIFSVDALYYLVSIAGLVFWIIELRKSRMPSNTLQQSQRGIRIALTSPWLLAAAGIHLINTFIQIV